MILNDLLIYLFSIIISFFAILYISRLWFNKFFIKIWHKANNNNDTLEYTKLKNDKDMNTNYRLQKILILIFILGLYPMVASGTRVQFIYGAIFILYTFLLLIVPSQLFMYMLINKEKEYFWKRFFVISGYTFAVMVSILIINFLLS